MKVEIIKKTKQYTGDVFYSLNVDGHYVDGSACLNLEQIKEKIDKIKMFPETTEEIIDTIEI